MRITVLGSSPAVPNPGGACSGYLVESCHGDCLLLECGHGSVSVLQTVCDVGSLSAILISHMHPDHFFDLVPLAYANLFGRLAPKRLYLPPGGIGTLRRLEAAIGLHENFFSESFDIREFDPNRVLTVGDLSIRFTETEHYIPAFAMRFESAENPSAVFAFTSDTAWSDDVTSLLQDATLALAEAAVLEYDPTHETQGHMTPDRAGALARKAGVKQLVLTHYSRKHGDRIRSQAEGSFGGTVGLAVEGDVFEVRPS